LYINKNVQHIISLKRGAKVELNFLFTKPVQIIFFIPQFFADNRCNRPGKCFKAYYFIILQKTRC
jgi:hypothetical protein